MAESEPEALLRRALEALEAIPDAAERARVGTRMLRDWPNSHESLGEIRRQAVLTLQAQGLTFEEIGRIIGTTRQTAERIAKARKKPRRPAAGASDQRQGEQTAE